MKRKKKSVNWRRLSASLAEELRQQGEAIRSARMRAGVSARQLAIAMGWTKQFMSHVELGKHRLPYGRVVEFCSRLGVSPQSLGLKTIGGDR